ncbi:CGNR zinc finger domain-containing protein [Dietzia timorensis]
MTRLRRCALVPCLNVNVGISSNGTQRYCSPRRASRGAVRRHRARNRQA